jgi:chromosome segregation ATPase
MDEKIIIEGFQRMENNFRELKTEIGGMKTEIHDIKTEIGGMKTEIGEVKTEIGEMKMEIGGIKTEICGMKTDIKSLKEDLNDLNETVNFIKDNAVSQIEFKELATDLNQFKLTTQAEFNNIKSTMVTKDYLDEKLYEFKSEIIQETRAGEKRLERLAGVLAEGRAISPTQHQFVMNG